MSEKYSTEELVEEITVAFEARIESIDDGYTKSGDERLTKMAPTVKELTQRIKSIIIARLRAGENLENKSLMKLAADLGVSFSAAKIISDHAREEYDAKITKADKLLRVAKKARFIISVYCKEHIKEYDKAIAEYEVNMMARRSR